MPPKRRRTGGGRSTSRRSNVLKSTESDNDQPMPDADTVHDDADLEAPLEDDVADVDAQTIGNGGAPDPVAESDNEPVADEKTTAVATPVDDTEVQEDDEDDPEDESGPVRPRSVVRRRRGGARGRSSRGIDSPILDNDDSEAGPAKRRGGWRGGFRGRPRYGPKSQPDRVAIDKEGTMMDVVDDEVALPEDPDGENKVDKLGMLAEGRRYRVRVFTIKGRGERLYMLSTEPARCTGFRDSYLFFTKHLTLYKVVLNDEQKLDLIERELMPNSYKGRSIAVVTARSVFREFGARIIVGGKRIMDDYYVQAARASGAIEGELADPNDRAPGPGESYNRNQYVAWHGASQVYHTQNQMAPVATGRPAQSKRRLHITTTNWQYEHAKDASKFNSTIATIRKANLGGLYDMHTNLMLQPQATQPTHAKWDHVENDNDQGEIRLLTNGDMQHSQPRPQAFSSLPGVIARNFLVTDTYFESPPIANAGVPGAGFDNGVLTGLAGVSDDLIAELPAECKSAFLAARATEAEWKAQWQNETLDGLRRPLRIGVNGYPV